MATNLLLEGDDLEALLMKAHSQGGPHARIVRADKYRHGGLWGFFARERFEVAVEIPESPAPDPAADPDSAADPAGDSADRPALAAAAAALDALEQSGRAASFRPPTSSRPAHSGPVGGPVGGPGAGWASGADSAGGPTGGSGAAGWPTGATGSVPTGAYGASAAGAYGASPTGTPHPGLLPPGLVTHSPARPWSTRPTPTTLAVDGLLDVADRVSAAEQAAARAMEAIAPSPGPAPDPFPEPVDHSSIALPGAELVGATLASMAAGRRGPVASPSPRRTGEASSASSSAPSSSAPSAAAPSSASAGSAGFVGSGSAAWGEDDLDPSQLLRSHGEVPVEEFSPVRPSTARPEFTALLDQLREGARPAPGRLRTAEQAAAYRDAELLPPDAPLSSGSEMSHADRAADAARSPQARTAPSRTTRGGSTREGISQDGTSQNRTAHDGTSQNRTVQYGTSRDRTAQERTAQGRSAAGRPARSSGAVPGPRSGGEGIAAEEDEETSGPSGVRTADPRAAADRRTLRALGVPPAWTRRMRPGDRFTEVMRMLERMPDADIDPDAAVIAVVGSPSAVRLEAHRIAVDLAVGDQPRSVVAVPAEVGTERAGAIARALRSGSVVLAVETDGRDSGLVLDTLTTVQASAVIAVVDAAAPLETTQRWIDALGQVDALTLDGGSGTAEPAAALQLGLPVIRVDGIPVDRVTWAALLCAQLAAAEQSGSGLAASE